MPRRPGTKTVGLDMPCFAEELVEDVDGGGAEEGFVVVAAVFVEGAGGTAVGLAAVAVPELVAGAFGEGFEVFVDGACEAEAAVDAVVDEPAGGGVAGEFLGALFEGVGGGFEGVGDVVVFGVGVVGVHHEGREAAEVVLVNAEFEWGGLDGGMFGSVESGDISEVSDPGVFGVNAGFDAVVLVFAGESSFDVFGDFDPTELCIH